VYPLRRQCNSVTVQRSDTELHASEDVGAVGVIARPGYAQRAGGANEDEGGRRGGRRP
jgi:hypothetical protein